MLVKEIYIRGVEYIKRDIAMRINWHEFADLL